MENNFGSINAIFLQNAESLLKTSKGKKIVKEYINKIKGSKELLKQYSLYEFIENQVYSDNVKEYITEYVNYCNSIDKKKLKLENKELFDLINENKAKINLDIVVENSGLYADIDGLLFNKPGIQGVKEKVNKINSIVECIKNQKPRLNESKEVFEFTDEAMAYAVNKFNNKYKEQLSPEDKSLFEKLTKTKEDEQVTLFEEKKNECLNLTNSTLKEAIDNSTREKLLSVKETLLEDKYNKDSFVEDILRFVELKDTLSED